MNFSEYRKQHRLSWDFDNFSELDLQGCDFQDDMIWHSSFVKSDLSNSNMQEALFQECNFTNACLKNCKVVGADFEGSDFTGADLTDTDFSRAVFNDCKGNFKEIFSDHITFCYKLVFFAPSKTLAIGCQTYPLEDWWANNIYLHPEDFKLWRKHKQEVLNIVDNWLQVYEKLRN
jgi:hypothetical protein